MIFSDVQDVRILEVAHVKGCGISVTFEDGTRAHFPAEELLSLRPHREPIGEPDERWLSPVGGAHCGFEHLSRVLVPRKTRVGVVAVPMRPKSAERRLAGGTFGGMFDCFAFKLLNSILLWLD